MKRFFVFLGVVFMTIGSAVSAQEVDSMAPLQKSSWGDAKTSEAAEYVPDISLDARFGAWQDFSDETGRFGGDGLYLDINGKISPHLSYSLNHRIAAPDYGEASGFDATNWLTLTYEVGDFEVTMGKDALLVGSFEYDAYDLDSYYDMNSMFYNSFDCWQWGVSMSWYPAESHSVTFQVANSPFSSGEPNLYSYAAAWRAETELYESYWTANLWQYDEKAYVKAINLGNRFYFGDFTIDVEYMTRAFENVKFFEDFTAILAPSYETDCFRYFAKVGLENSPDLFGYEDVTGKNYCFYGLGMEYFPIKGERNLRVHAAYSGNNFGMNIIEAGLTVKFDITGAAKSLFGSRNL